MRIFLSNRLKTIDIVVLLYFIISYVYVIASAFILRIPTELMIISLKGLTLTSLPLIIILLIFQIFNHQ
jgi:hypothetical protein